MKRLVETHIAYEKLSNRIFEVYPVTGLLQEYIHSVVIFMRFNEDEILYIISKGVESENQYIVFDHFMNVMKEIRPRQLWNTYYRSE